MMFLPSCKDVEAKLTELTEGTLSFREWLGIRLHLAMCHPCATLLLGFRALPRLGKRLLSPRDTIPPQAIKALEEARKHLRADHP